MNADEQIAVCSTEGRPAGELDQRVVRSREDNAQAAAHQLRPHQLPDTERDVFLGQPAREVQTGISRVDAAMPRIHDDRMGQS